MDTNDTTMVKGFECLQKLGQTNVGSAIRMFGEWNKNGQAIAAEVGKTQSGGSKRVAQPFRSLWHPNRLRMPSRCRLAMRSVLL
jgi:hypothetical protein